MKEITLESRYLACRFDELSASDRSLVERAKEATSHSYAPYSHFCVGAAALLADGTVVTGSNQENAAYPSGLCAERTTLFYAGAQHPDQAVCALAIAARDTDGFTAQPTPPCGACRQVMLETEMRHQQPMRILLYGESETYVIKGVRTLLPFIFDGSFLR